MAHYWLPTLAVPEKYARFTGYFLLALGVLFFSAPAHAACPVDIRTPWKMLPLFNPEFLGRLENENRLSGICRAGDEACKAAARAKRSETISIHDAPEGRVIASLVIDYIPAEGIAARVTRDGTDTPYVPPLFDQDWGYGPWFHATLLDMDGAWKKIALPAVLAGWIKTDAEPLPVPQYENEVLKMGDATFVITSADDQILSLRAEQPADMWCEIGDPPPLSAATEKTYTPADLYDDSCNLTITKAYTRGC